MKRGPSTAVVVVSHGSKQKDFARAMKRAARSLARERKYRPVLCAYLEVARPSIPEAIERCVRGGARRIKILPYFLLTGKHVIRDIPRIVREARKRHAKRATIELCAYLGFHKKIVDVMKQRLR